MPGLDSIANIVISLNSQGVARASFNTLLLLAPNSTGLSIGTKVKTVGSVADMVAAGLKVYEDAYIAGKQIFLQAEHPTSIKIGFWDKTGGVTASQALALIDTVDSDYFFVIVLSETVGDISSAGSYCETRTNPAMVFGQVADADSLTGAGNAQTLRALAYDWSTSWWHLPAQHMSTLTISGAIVVGSTINMDVNGTPLAAVPFAVNSDTTLANVAVALQALASITTATVTAVAGGTDNDREIVITAAHGTLIYISNYADTGGASSTGAIQADVTPGPEWLNAAVIGVAATTQPGSETWKFLQPDAMTDDVFLSTDIATLQSAKCNFFTKYGSLAMTAEGKNLAGDWIDTVRFIGWLQINMQADVVDLLASASPKKIPYTDGGIAQIEAVIWARLHRGEEVGGIAPGTSKVVVPLSADVDPVLKAARELDLTFSATLAGAIHKLVVNGTLSE